MGGTALAGRLAAILLMAALGACQSTFSASPEGIPVALESIDGAPDPIRTALADELATAATDRKVDLVGASAAARYRVRGYLSTSTEDGETKVAYVWDVFDSQKRRAKRLEGSSPVPAASISSLDKQALAKLAQASMDEIADFLSASKSQAPAASEAPIQTAEVQSAEALEDESQVAMQ
jgi:hypothetical protein